MANREDHTYTQQITVTKKDRKKDHTYFKGNNNNCGNSTSEDGAQPSQVADLTPKPDHSYSVADKPKVTSKEKHENRKQLPYPLRGDHEYVRGKPETKEIIVSYLDPCLVI